MATSHTAHKERYRPVKVLKNEAALNKIAGHAVVLHRG